MKTNSREIFYSDETSENEDLSSIKETKLIKLKKNRNKTINNQKFQFIRNLLIKAQNLFLLERYDEVIKIAGDIVAEDHKQSEAYFLIQKSLEAQGEIQKSINVELLRTQMEECRKPLKWIELSRKFKVIHNAKQSLYCINRALKLKKNDPQILFEKAQLLEETGSSFQATKYYEKSLIFGFFDIEICRKLVEKFLLKNQKLRAIFLLANVLKFSETNLNAFQLFLNYFIDIMNKMQLHRLVIYVVESLLISFEKFIKICSIIANNIKNIKQVSIEDRLIFNNNDLNLNYFISFYSVDIQYQYVKALILSEQLDLDKLMKIFPIHTYADLFVDLVNSVKIFPDIALKLINNFWNNDYNSVTRAKLLEVKLESLYRKNDSHELITTIKESVANYMDYPPLMLKIWKIMRKRLRRRCSTNSLKTSLKTSRVNSVLFLDEDANSPKYIKKENSKFVISKLAELRANRPEFFEEIDNVRFIMDKEYPKDNILLLYNKLNIHYDQKDHVYYDNLQKLLELVFSLEERREKIWKLLYCKFSELSSEEWVQFNRLKFYKVQNLSVLKRRKVIKKSGKKDHSKLYANFYTLKIFSFSKWIGNKEFYSLCENLIKFLKRIQSSQFSGLLVKIIGSRLFSTHICFLNSLRLLKYAQKTAQLDDILISLRKLFIIFQKETVEQKLFDLNQKLSRENLVIMILNALNNNIWEIKSQRINTFNFFSKACKNIIKSTKINNFYNSEESDIINVIAKTTLANIHYVANSYSKCFNLYHSLKNFQPALCSFMSFLCNIHLAVSRFCSDRQLTIKEAFNEFYDYAKYSPEAQVRYNLGRLLTFLGEYEYAVAVFEKGLREHYYVKTALNIVSIYRRLGNKNMVDHIISKNLNFNV